ncbi:MULTISPECIES: anthranilate phosphoribosyltransferase [Thermoanaerobacterium]|jgi:anthranilate phosphoribosyltransferase|uniref:Anthranilate phosphoribosyltransferase n=1 Tax=Thermoanaerobacterium butyriciformans TaxID=1702242 RepID=A0ABS4NI22_9THEO|nr:anthranilate phosphoribosyltransferase [Thermoanaerobacterium butyriciformans]MBP2073318.1 anthranilate phosphoribosyltransferase [Thermoanaerobacterium butyriciformans]MDK2806641.1 anthranilate phosphoribosyltransferase [Thermoanaerobacterium sp.]WHE07942.1 anthranilate phosphoribosyltransferase [Thermoanaerobacterium thermosaccharolyticum]
MLKEAIEKIVMGENLTESEAKSAMDSIMKGESSSALIGGYLIGLRMKGETVDEITGSAKSMIGNAVKLKLDSPYVIDTCGTGGDGGRTFNISTAVAIITSSAGVKIAKHGNRAVSSKSGSADVLSELGVKIDLEPEITKKFIDDVGFGFLYAPKYHSAMKNVAPIRRELGLRTVFNILGPLTNPASAKGQVLGVYDKKLTHVLAEVLLKLGCERALVVYGNDGLDEITTTTTTTVSEVKNGTVIDYTIDPHDYGINLSKDTDINGGDSKENAKIILDILEGQKGPKRDIVVLNSAAALYVGKAVDNIKEGVLLAEHLIDSGAALGKLNEILSYQKVYLQ